MKNILIIPILLIGLAAFGQSAEELNAQSKELLIKGDFTNALPLLRKAAELGNAEAQYNLGYSLQNGISVEKNEKEAFEWYKKSSENGFNDGHYAMMMAYSEGSGTEPNYEKAFEYALKCANNEDPTCMWNIANCYMQGIGTQKDSTKFLEWTTKLALLENPENLMLSSRITSSRLSLAHMYKTGDSVEKKDLYQSYLWYLIYNESKRDFSTSQQNNVITEIKELKDELGENNLKNAQADAETLLGRKLQNFKKLFTVDI